jgi:hypothetical protein
MPVRLEKEAPEAGARQNKNPGAALRGFCIRHGFIRFVAFSAAKRFTFRRKMLRAISIASAPVHPKGNGS